MTKDIKGYEGLYRISNKGFVIGFKNNRQLKIDTSSGYSRVILQNNGKKERFLVHRLVAIHFIDGYFDGAVVNHIDGNKNNNHYTNLEYVTRSENIKRMWKRKLAKAESFRM